MSVDQEGVGSKTSRHLVGETNRELNCDKQKPKRLNFRKLSVKYLLQNHSKVRISHGKNTSFRIWLKPIHP